jgi:hypothetical protein
MFSGYQPKNPSGPPPYIFENVALGAFERDIGVTYNAPAPWNKLPSVNLEDMFTVRVTAGAGHWNDSYSVLPCTVLAAGSTPAPQELPPAQDDSGLAGKTDAAALAVGANSAASYSWWYTEFYFGLGQSTTMTTDLCQGSVGYLQGGNFFVAVRYPTSAAAGASSAIPGPFRYGETNGYPRLDLLNETPWPNTVVVSMPLAVAPEWMTYAANSLPQAAGERWVTMAPSSETQATCPANLNLPNWEFYAYVPMDAGPTPSAWSDKVLPGYFCFVTSSPPPFLESLATALGLGAEEADTTSAQVTAMGPFPIRLAGNPPNPPYLVSGPQMAVVKPPGQVQLRFLVENPGTTPLQVTTSVSSSLHLSWGIYRGSFDAPYLTNPVQGAIDLGHGEATPVWVVANVPAGVTGAETVIFTATSTSPAGSTWNSGLVWLGNPSNLGRTIRRHLPHK